MKNQFLIFLLLNVIIAPLTVSAQGTTANMWSYSNAQQYQGGAPLVRRPVGRAFSFSRATTYRTKIPLSVVRRNDRLFQRNSSVFLNRRPPIIEAGGTGTGNETWIAHYASGMAPGYQVANSIAVNANGNPILTGFATRTPYGADMVTTEYDSSGKQLWQENFTMGGDAIGTSVRADSAGDVYVLGEATDGATGVWRDVLVKYDSGGVQKWLIKLDGDGGFYLGSLQASVDASENILVTGDSSNYFIARKYGVHPEKWTWS